MINNRILIFIFSATLNTPARPIPSKSSQSSIKNYFKIQTPHEITKSQSPSIQKLIPRNILSLTSSKNENPSSFANDLNTSTIPRLGKSIQNSAVIQRAASSSKKTQIKAVKQKRLPKEVPAYKVVEGTTFGVDAFQFGDIEGVTTYFLTHFHMDHYVGLKKSFSFPLYVSPITGTKLLQLYFLINVYKCLSSQLDWLRDSLASIEFGFMNIKLMCLSTLTTRRSFSWMPISRLLPLYCIINLKCSFLSVVQEQ